jgi:hypothetical protein
MSLEFPMTENEINYLNNEIEKFHVRELDFLRDRLDNIEKKVEIELNGIEDKIEKRLENSEQRIANLAVNKAFGHLGIDVNNPKDLQVFRDDLRFGGIFRSAATKSFYAMIAAIFGGIGLSIWMAFKDQMGLK